MSLIKKIILIIIGVILLLGIAIINNYPLITQDTAAYINMAYAWFFPSDRPAYYGVFIKVVSLSKSIWWPVIAQSFLLSFLVVNLILKILPQQKVYQSVLLFLALVFLTPVTWISSQITADIFTAVVLLGAILYLLSDNIKIELVYLAITFYAMLTHNSNTLSMLCFSTILLGISGWKYRRCLRKISVLIGLTIISYFTLCTTNYYTNDAFTFSKAGHVFFMGKMVESGLLKNFLDDKCASKNFALCAYKDSLPPYAADFIWQEGKAFHKTGGWHGSKEEYSEIIRATLTTPKYLKFHIKESVYGTIKQVGLTYVGDLLYPFTEGTHPYNLIEKWLPNSIPFMLKAKQQKNELSFNLVSSIYSWTLFLSGVIGLILLFSRIHMDYKIILIAVLVFIVSNAFVTATFANVIGRLNARVVWVLPLIVGLLCLHLYQSKKRV